MQIDMRYLYGRDVRQILNIYDFAPDTYYASGTFSFNGRGGELNSPMDSYMIVEEIAV